jgi:hypothetical protein
LPHEEITQPRPKPCGIQAVGLDITVERPPKVPRFRTTPAFEPKLKPPALAVENFRIVHQPAVVSNEQERGLDRPEQRRAILALPEDDDWRGRSPQPLRLPFAAP